MIDVKDYLVTIPSVFLENSSAFSASFKIFSTGTGTLIPVFIPNINSNVQRTYSPWAFLGYISFYSAFWIREIGMPNHPWCNPDSLLQAHMVWHLLCAVATISFFNFQRTEKLNKI